MRNLGQGCLRPLITLAYRGFWLKSPLLLASCSQIAQDQAERSKGLHLGCCHLGSVHSHPRVPPSKSPPSYPTWGLEGQQWFFVFFGQETGWPSWSERQMISRTEVQSKALSLKQNTTKTSPWLLGHKTWLGEWIPIITIYFSIPSCQNNKHSTKIIM